MMKTLLKNVEFELFDIFRVWLRVIGIGDHPTETFSNVRRFFRTAQ